MTIVQEPTFQQLHD